MKDMEREVKLCLQKREFFLILNYLQEKGEFLEEQSQVNYYLDSPGRELLDKGEMFRLRLLDESVLITLKYNVHATDGFFECSQVEEEFCRKELDSPEEIISELNLEEFFPYLPSELVVVGSLSNLRRVFQWGIYILELDETTLPGQEIEYELECETKDPQDFKKEIQKLFQELNLEMRPQKKTKYARFLQSLNELTT
ncbi:CYTH domain-containing protein [bacterium]|jgi:uncharacterized protein YjbK|nr:CYTH domain-containing protein [bacterium]